MGTDSPYETGSFYFAKNRKYSLCLYKPVHRLEKPMRRWYIDWENVNLMEYSECRPTDRSYIKSHKVKEARNAAGAFLAAQATS